LFSNPGLSGSRFEPIYIGSGADKKVSDPPGSGSPTLPEALRTVPRVII